MNIFFTLYYGKPLFIWFGMIGGLLIVMSALIAIWAKQGKYGAKLTMHSQLSQIGLVFALIHMLVALFKNFK